MAELYDSLTQVTLNFDIEAVRQLVAAGADLNIRSEFGEPFLFDAVSIVMPYDEATAADPARYAFITALIELGADPCQLADDGGNIFLTPIFAMDLAMIELLLNYGVNPNHGCGDSDTYETTYETAIVDYDYEAWLKAGLPFPVKKEIATIQGEDEFLRQLDEMAQVKGVERPEICKLLRRHGALSNSEMVKKLGGDASQRAIWRDGGWQLADW